MIAEDGEGRDSQRSRPSTGTIQRMWCMLSAMSPVTATRSGCHVGAAIHDEAEILAIRRARQMQIAQVQQMSDRPRQAGRRGRRIVLFDQLDLKHLVARQATTDSRSLLVPTGR